MMSNMSVHIKYPTHRDYIPPLACSVTGDFCSFGLASRGTALTLRLRDSFQPLTCGLSRKSQAAPAQRSHRYIVPAYSPASGSIPVLLFQGALHTNLFLLYGIITLNMNCEKTEDFR